MRILLLAQVLPYPPDSGPKVKTFGTVQALATAHDVTVLAFVRSPEESVQARHLAAHGCAVRVVPLRRGRLHDLRAAGRALLTGQSLLLARDHRTRMHRAVRRLLRSGAFDAIHVDQINMAQYVPRGFRGKMVFDAHNAVWMITERMATTARNPLRRFALRHESRRMLRAEGRACRRADVVLTTSREDATALRAAEAGHRTEIIPIGVSVPAVPVHRGDTPVLLHVGTMFYPPNADAVRWFAAEVFGQIRAAVPEARFLVVGARPPKEIRDLHDPAAGIEVLGYVPDIRPLMAGAAAMVVPTRAGSGMRVKILEAMAAGLPVVSTTVGAEGIAVVPGEHLLVADEAPAFAAAAVQLLTDPATRARIGRAAHARALACYDLEVTGAALRAVYDTLAPKRTREPSPTAMASPR